ncbi:MAG: EAL domain-containing protein [Nitrospinota bacterium]|nr:EAL domain-containing protein [Nitrospinota bacterium]
MPNIQTIFDATFENSTHGMYLARLDHRLDQHFVMVNTAFCEQLGYAKGELLKKSLDQLTFTEEVTVNLEIFNKLKTGKLKQYRAERRLIRKDGRSFPARLCVSPIFDDLGKIKLFSVMVEDVTEPKRKESMIQIAEKVYERSDHGVVITDKDAIIQFVNPAFTAITGYDEKEAIGQHTRLLKSGRHEPEFYTKMWERLQKEGSWEGEIWNRNKGGEAYQEYLKITAIKDGRGKVTNYTAVFSDLTRLRNQEEKIRFQAYHDELTGLPNRTLYFDRVDQAITRAHRSGKKLAVMFLDLDNFKIINDSLSHSTGDVMLQGVSARLISSLRETDTVARLGGDEFTILVEDVEDEKQISVVASKIMRSISEPFLFNGEDLFVTSSLGIAMFPSDGVTGDDLIKNADTAMYHAKEQGKNNFQFFTENMNQKVIKRLEVETNLRKALDRNEMFACYQPKVDLRTGRIVGMEALIRWRRNGLDTILPIDFIPLAEETGLILGLDEWMLSQACAFNKRIHEAGAESFSVSVNVAVNVSAKAFESPDIVENIRKVVEDSGLEPRYIELEVTESSIIRNVDKAVGILGRLRDLGFNISMDDFGTGYSSLSYLARLPINILKIDRSFVIDLYGNPKAKSIARAITAMSKEMNIKVVAEGVEKEEQLLFLREIGCDEVQGYLFSRPLLEDEMAELISNGKCFFPQELSV